MDNQLSHNGVKGMRWGVVKAVVDAGSSSASTAKTLHEKVTKRQNQVTKSIVKSKAKTMTDDELKARVSRLNLEEQYTKLSTTDVQQGHNRIDKILSVTATALTLTSAALAVAVSVQKLASKAT